MGAMREEAVTMGAMREEAVVEEAAVEGAAAEAAVAEAVVDLPNPQETLKQKKFHRLSFKTARL